MDRSQKLERAWVADLGGSVRDLERCCLVDAASVARQASSSLEIVPDGTKSAEHETILARTN